MDIERIWVNFFIFHINCNYYSTIKFLFLQKGSFKLVIQRTGSDVSNSQISSINSLELEIKFPKESEEFFKLYFKPVVVIELQICPIGIIPQLFFSNFLFNRI
jgi:hypothetical protein